MTARSVAAVVCVGMIAVASAACDGGSSTSATTGRPNHAPAITASEASAPVTGASGRPSTATGMAASRDHSCAAPYPTGAPTTSTVFCADPANMDAASVIRIVDGDTMHVLLNGKDETVRFYGINATEVGQPCSAEATARTRQLVGNDVRLRPDARERDRYGRLLRYVYTPAGLSVDAELVDEGLAHAWRADGALRVPIIAIEDAAHAGGVGCLWH